MANKYGITGRKFKNENNNTERVFLIVKQKKLFLSGHADKYFNILIEISLLNIKT